MKKINKDALKYESMILRNPMHKAPTNTPKPSARRLNLGQSHPATKKRRRVSRMIGEV
jgi:hypothetical protein